MAASNFGESRVAGHGLASGGRKVSVSGPQDTKAGSADPLLLPYEAERRGDPTFNRAVDSEVTDQTRTSAEPREGGAQLWPRRAPQVGERGRAATRAHPGTEPSRQTGLETGFGNPGSKWSGISQGEFAVGEEVNPCGAGRWC